MVMLVVLVLEILLLLNLACGASFWNGAGGGIGAGW